MSKLIIEKTDEFFKVELNNPRKLNVLDLDIVDSLNTALIDYNDNHKHLPFILMGAGPKGFCAGGDVVSVVEGIRKGSAYDFFFKEEYGLDKALHSTPNSVALAHGIVMGGGLGLFMGCEHKLLDSGSLLAMPEVTIGFHPDVGASYFLQSIPRRWRLFMTLTGARLSAIEFYFLGLADGFWDFELGASQRGLDYESFTDSLLKNIGNEARESFELKNQKIAEIEKMSRLEEFDFWCSELSVRQDTDRWLKQSVETYLSGSPVSKVLTWSLFNWCREKSIDECFEMDLKVAKIACEKGDFFEGVRALLIDKDKLPSWKDPSVAAANYRLKEELAIFN